ncbi:MAG TPA: helix-turn-helix transcriptional regulator [Candidatus Onthousia faecavium]|nr:helix-turn-helix transcriptional regulator [Candidatus Onthousia faecavium]
MNKHILKKLMKKNSLTSYLQLSKAVDIPYTTLLDLINGRGERLSNFRIIANYFAVPLSTLISKNKYILLTEDDKILIKDESNVNVFLSFLL